MSRAQRTNDCPKCDDARGLWVFREGQDRGDVRATVILISGCQDNQLSVDLPAGGLFTQALLRVWDNGSFKGSYSRFHRYIRAQMPPTQTPNYFVVGAINHAFEHQMPFAI